MIGTRRPTWTGKLAALVALIKHRPKISLRAPTKLSPGQQVTGTVIIDARRDVPIEAITVDLVVQEASVGEPAEMIPAADGDDLPERDELGQRPQANCHEASVDDLYDAITASAEVVGVLMQIGDGLE